MRGQAEIEDDGCAKQMLEAGVYGQQSHSNDAANVIIPFPILRFQLPAV